MSNPEGLTPNATVAQDNLEAFLAQRGCSPNLKQGIEITAAPTGSGKTDISINHDRILDKQPLESQS